METGPRDTSFNTSSTKYVEALQSSQTWMAEQQQTKLSIDEPKTPQYHLRLLKSLRAGRTSSGNSVILPGKLTYRRSNDDVIVKIFSNKNKADKEYKLMEEFHRKSQNHFVRPIKLFFGLEDARVDYEGDEIANDCANSWMLVMEKGERDVEEVLTGKKWKDKNKKTLRLKEIALDMLTILDHMHSLEYVYMDFKPANIIQVHSKDDDFTKAIDFETCLEFGTEIKSDHGATFEYISPELAKFLISSRGVSPSTLRANEKMVRFFILHC